MKPTCGRSGLSLIEVVVSLAILVTGLYAIFGAQFSSRKIAKSVESRSVAENYASELLETFLSLSSTKLAGYLAAIPMVSGTPGYPLCSHINLLDRAASTPGSAVYLNRDPLADLPRPSSIENLESQKHLANRFYQVQVVNAKTLVVNPAACGYYASANGCGVIGMAYGLCTDERFLVTVGVSYVPAGKTDANVLSISLSSVLAEN